jgi:hypothetical protein
VIKKHLYITNGYSEVFCDVVEVENDSKEAMLKQATDIVMDNVEITWEDICQECCFPPEMCECD